ncbi:MAG: aminodeoxychorismate synthase component I [Xanthomonadales bacterium]|jgi:anthranilate synthase component 1|nr:aminodeoxychorismate synthase component I [Xanthomonadales bacterium]
MRAAPSDQVADELLTPRVTVLPAIPDLAALQRRDRARFPALLQSLATAPRTGRWDLLFVHAGRRAELAATDPLPDWVAAALATPLPMAVSDLPFTGGVVLLATYELAERFEPSLCLPPCPNGLPALTVLEAPAAVLVDRQEARALLVSAPGRDALHAELLGILAFAASSASGKAAPALPAFALSEDPPQAFLDGVAAIREYIAAGDVFQVNLSRAWAARAEAALDPLDLYAALARANPAPFAASLCLPQATVLSSSPERLVSLRGDVVETRPIAGTRPRGADDAARIAELIGDPKERAEHIMLIDLERNDLGRVCAAGSVEVDELYAVESYTHVHHIVSNVRGRLRPGVTALEVLAAVFPGGTITGCPKVRCMQIIAALEQTGRGAYTGALGYVGPAGMDLNILIRTLTVVGDTVHLRAGAGIVADSVPERELAETRAKARGLLRALGQGG